MIPVFQIHHEIQHKLQKHGTAKCTTFNLEIGEARGPGDILNVMDADESQVGHGFGAEMPLLAARCGALVVGAVRTENLAAELLAAGKKSNFCHVHMHCFLLYLNLKKCEKVYN